MHKGGLKAAFRTVWEPEGLEQQLASVTGAWQVEAARRQQAARPSCHSEEALPKVTRINAISGLYSDIILYILSHTMTKVISTVFQVRGLGWPCTLRQGA